MKNVVKLATIITATLALFVGVAMPPVAAVGSAQQGSVEAGQEYSLYIDQYGNLYEFGRSFAHEKGQSDSPYYIPTKVMSDVKEVSAGGSHYVILKKDGSVWTTGHGNQGELGDGRHYMSTVGSPTPGDVEVRTTKVFENAVAVAAGDSHTLVLDKNGDVWATGRNMGGELGDGTTTDRVNFVKVKGISGVKAIAAGDWHNLALTESGDLYAWGSSPYGALGDGRGVQVGLASDGWSHTAVNHIATTPQFVASGVRAMSAGGGASYVILNDNTLWACGYGMGYRLGDGTNTSTSTLIQIMDNVQDVDAGNAFVLALKADGTVWGWGTNIRGNIGVVASLELVKNPVKVVDNAVAISAGWDHSMILKSDGSLWTTGGNDRGQLGNGKLPTELKRQYGFEKIESIADRNV